MSPRGNGFHDSLLVWGCYDEDAADWYEVTYASFFLLQMLLRCGVLQSYSMDTGIGTNDRLLEFFIFFSLFW